MNHPLAHYSNKNDSPLWAYAFTGLVGYLTFFYESSRRLLPNPRDYSYFYKYFKEAIELNSAYEKSAREAFSYIREHTLRDDQVALLMQMRRSKLYAEIFLADRGQQLHVNELKKLLRVIINDASKFTSNNRIKSSGLGFINNSDENVSSLGSVATELRHYSNVLNQTMTRLLHYLDLMWGQKERYGSLQKISWSRNSLELLSLLEKEEARIHDKLGGLESFTATPEESEVFLQISPKLRWEIIYESFCPFEQEAMGHCGATARSGCYLLSLRELTRYWERWDSDERKFVTKDLKEEVWIPKVTATVCPLHEDIHSEYYGDKKPKYDILDILGPKNKSIEEKWIAAVEELFEDPRIVQEEEHQPDNAFTTKNLSKEKRLALYEKKPSLAPASWQIEKASLQQLRNLWLKFVKPYVAKNKGTEFLIKDLKLIGKTFVLIKGDYLTEFLEKLKRVCSVKLEDSIDEILRNIEDSPNVDVSYNRGDMQGIYDDLYKIMTDEQKKKFKKLVEEETEKSLNDYERDEWRLIKDLDVGRAFYDAYFTGWEVGSRDSAHYAYERALDGQSLISEQSVLSLLIKKEKNGKWYGYLGEKELRTILIDQAEFNTSPLTIFYTTERSENDSRYGHFGSISWEFDYDYEAAAERFKDEISMYLT